tara:strand:+ start:217 stop:363 length:147 start_codon:yes stop_codon:yes gene_type:complete
MKRSMSYTKIQNMNPQEMKETIKNLELSLKRIKMVKLQRDNRLKEVEE